MLQTVMTLVLLLQILSALTMIGLVLVQHGKGADMGASFGSGASGSLFGATGSANFLSRSTAVAASVFFATTLALAYFGNHRTTAPQGASVLEQSALAASAASGVSSVAVPASAAASTGAALIPNK
jgi:preprotein translocase subunit SecG